MALDRAGFAALSDVSDFPRAEVTLPGGMTAFVRCMTVGERDKFLGACRGQIDSKVRTALLASTLCDEQGGRLYTLDDLAEVEAFPFRVADPLFKAASELNRLDDESRADLGNDSGRTPASGG